MALISLKQWAEAAGISAVTARQRAQRGSFKTAIKIGRDWVIDENEKLVDHRRKADQVQQSDAVEKMIEQIVEEYHCYDIHSESCDDCCSRCENELREDIKKLVELVIKENAQRR